jgi:hypothetical protein
LQPQLVRREPPPIERQLEFDRMPIGIGIFDLGRPFRLASALTSNSPRSAPSGRIMSKIIGSGIFG